MNNSAIIVGDINVSLSITCRISSKQIGDLNSRNNELDLIDIYKTPNLKKICKHHFKWKVKTKN